MYVEMGNQKKILTEQLDKKLIPFKGIEKVIIPEIGWISSIRKSLNMTLEQLGLKLNITKQGAKSIEKSEVSGTISLKALKEVGKALDMHFVYGFVPMDGSIENLVDIKAKKLAQKIVLRTHQSMKLENQENSDARINKAIEELADEIKREMRKSLWD